jgi:hypothetical protein
MYRAKNTLGHNDIRSHRPAAYRIADIGTETKPAPPLARDPKTSATPH